MTIYRNSNHTPDRPVTASDVARTKDRVKAVVKTCEIAYDWLYSVTVDARLSAEIRRTMVNCGVDDAGNSKDDEPLYTLLSMVSAITRDAAWLAHTSTNALSVANEAIYKASVAEREAKFAKRKLAELEVRFADPVQLNSLAVNELLEPHVYIFRDRNGNALYVGKSINVLSRLAQHRKRSFYEEAETVELIRCDSDREMSELEQELIAKLDPAHNVVGRVAS